MNPPHVLRHLAIAGLLTTAGLLSACSSSSPAGSPAAPADSAIDAEPAGAGRQILPVKDNPIVNDSTAKTLVIDEVLVENNVDPATGGDAPDHLEIALSNTGTTELSGFEVFYTFNNTKTNVAESYYAKLPDSFTIAPGTKRVAHFDTTGAPDHFPVNKFSLYYTDATGFDVSVTVSASGAAVQTATTKKDPGDAETAD